MESVWDLIKAGDYERACEAADSAALASSSLLPLRNKIRALLQLRRLREAELLSDEIIRRDGGKGTSDVVFKGVAAWLQGAHSAAIATWRGAARKPYADAAGGAQIPLLLCYASVHGENEAMWTRSIEMLKAAAHATAWPGPLAGYVRGELDVVGLHRSLSSQPTLRVRQLCQTEFYVGVMLKRVGNFAAAAEAMRRACAEGGSALLEAEYYLAGWECEAEIGNTDDRTG